MVILQINNCHYRRGGADVVYLNTIKLLEKNGHQVICFSKKSKNNYPTAYDEYFINNVDFFNISLVKKILHFPRFLYSAESRNKIRKLIKDFRPDVAHIHLFKGDITPSILPVLRKAKIPVVITLHDYGLMCPHNLFLDQYYNICEKCIKYGPVACIINKCNRGNYILSAVSAIEFAFNSIFLNPRNYFDKIINVSKFSINKHSVHIPALRKKLEHLYNFSTNLETIIPDNKKGDYFLFYGRLSREKGVNTLLRTWAGLDTGFKLKIVGEGPLLEELIEYGRNSNLSNVEYLGFKVGDELDNLIKNASFIIVPSEWYENNPMTIVESYAWGKPVIGSDVGGIPEIIVNEKTGFIFKMGDVADLTRILYLACGTAQDAYGEMSANARSFAEQNFSEKTHYQKLIGIYKDAAQSGKEK